MEPFKLKSQTGNLPMKLGFVALLIVVSLWGTFARKLKLGIDLAGGHALIFEVMTNQAEVAKLQERQDA